MNEPKIFCEDCVYLETSGQTGAWLCSHVGNLGTWRSKTEPRHIPSFLNMENDCQWFNKIKVGPKY